MQNNYLSVNGLGQMIKSVFKNQKIDILLVNLLKSLVQFMHQSFYLIQSRPAINELHVIQYENEKDVFTSHFAHAPNRETILKLTNNGYAITWDLHIHAKSKYDSVRVYQSTIKKAKFKIIKLLYTIYFLLLSFLKQYQIKSKI